MLPRLAARMVARSTLRAAAPQAQARWHSEGGSEGPLSVKWIAPDGSVTVTKCKVGENLLELAHENGLNIEGACDGVCACSTCQLYVNEPWLDQLPEASDEEYDMLDQAFEVKPESRLGCQIVMTEELDGIEVRIPRATRNLYVDGHVPHHH